MRYLWTRCLWAVAACLAVGGVPSVSTGEEAVHFARRSATVGDVARQSVEFRLQMELQYLQGGQETPAESTEIVRRQSRILKVLEIGASEVTAARVNFVNATQEIRESGGTPQALPAPISGKTYDVARQDDTLQITDDGGAIPPFAEYELVAAAMASIGRPNPLAEYLGGRTVRVGETLTLPKELARLFFEAAENVDDIQRFELILRGRRDIENRSCGVFDMRLDAQSRGNSTMQMQIEGRLVVDTASCRVMDIRVVGPVVMRETRGPVGGQYEVWGQGKLQVAMAASYDDATQ